MRKNMAACEFKVQNQSLFCTWKKTIILLILMALCSKSNADPLKLENVVLQLTWRHQFQFAGYYAAKEKGFYQKTGIDVTIKEWGSGVIPVESVLTGKAQYGVSGAGSTVLLHRLRGKPVVVLAAIFQHSPMIFLTKKGSGILSPQDLVGRKIIMGPIEANAELYAMLHRSEIRLYFITSYNIKN